MKILLTGYPGFIGRRVVRALAARHPEARFVLLVQARLREVATRGLGDLGLGDRVELAVGDLTEAQLGLSSAQLEGVTDVWHLAAIYDLATAEDIAHKVNVDGTRHVLEVCRALPRLARHVYFSTCYVAGKRTGVAREDELDVGQGFNNHYESTKFLAEKDVRASFDQIPTTIIRPAVVVGDSRSGETDKYDGPYYIFKFFQRLPRWLPMPSFGPGTAPVNIVPVDFIVDGSVALSTNPAAVGQTCQLADPHPLAVREIADEVLRLLEHAPMRGRLPLWLIKAGLRYEQVRKLFGTPRETSLYLHHPLEFDTRNAQRLLEASNVRCPPLRDYLPALLRYMQQNPDKRFLDGRAR